MARRATLHGSMRSSLSKNPEDYKPHELILFNDAIFWFSLPVRAPLACSCPVCPGSWAGVEWAAGCVQHNFKGLLPLSEFKFTEARCWLYEPFLCAVFVHAYVGVRGWVSVWVVCAWVGGCVRVCACM